VYLPGLRVTVTVEVPPVPTILPSLSTPLPSIATPCLKLAGLDMTRVTLPAFAVSAVVLNASLLGTAESFTVWAVPPVGAAAAGVLAGALELDAVLAGALLEVELEPPQPAINTVASATVAVIQPVRRDDRRGMSNLISVGRGTQTLL
jgi:hypothetical protein